MIENKRLFQAIDLDRTLFDTSRFAKLITEEVNKQHPGVGSVLDAKFEEAYKNEVTFFLLRHLRAEMGDDAFEQMVEEIVDREGVDTLLMPGAKERIAFAEELSAVSPGWGVLTYGDEIDQRMKLKIAGLERAPALILGTPNKSEAIRTWQVEDGSFLLPSEFGGSIVDEISLEDDKVRAFIDIPPRVIGIWMMNANNSDKRHMAELPEGVIPVGSLYESMEYLRDRYSAAA